MFSLKKSIFVVLSVLFLFSCSKFGKPTKENLVIAIEKAPMSVDPRFAMDTFSDRICRLMYDGLLDIDDSFNYVPNLAESYSMPDDKTYIFKLKQGVKFHDGSILTSADVKYTYETIMDPKFGSIFRNAFDEVQNIETPDESTIIIKLKKPFAPFRTAVRIGIVSQKVGQRLGKEFAKEPTGTGIFKLKKNMGRDGLVLERFDGYHGGAAKIQYVTFKPVLDDTVRALELMKGSADLVLNAIPAGLLDEVKKNGKISAAVGDGVQYQYMGFNMEDPILKNIKVREAVAYAIDRDSLIKYKLGGLAKKSSGLLAPVSWAYSPNVTEYEFNPEKANKILDEAKFPFKNTKEGKYRFDLVYKTSTNPESLEIAGVIADNLKKIGINVIIRSLEFGVFFDDIKKGNFQLFTLSWTGITDPDQYYYIFNSKSFPPDGGNRGRYSNKKMDGLTELARVTLDQNKQKKIYAEIQKLASQDLPYVSLWHKDNLVAMRNNIKGFKLKANGDYYYLKDTFKE